MKWGKLQSPSINWSDTGSPSSEQYGDVYYNNESPLSGIEESRMVFLDGIGAPDVWQGKDTFTIVETGFGTGLNFFNTWKLWQKTASKNARLNFISIENSPLNAEQISKALAPFAGFKQMVTQFIEQYPPRQAGFHNLLLDDESVRLTLMFGDVADILPKLRGGVDAWFLDGFAPSKNPDMWGDTLFNEISRLSSPNAKVATFTAASKVRQALEEQGFVVEKQAGFGKKRERITAHLSGKAATRNKVKSIAIIGAGIAGATLAHKLQKRGVDVTLLDRHAKPAQETSSNPAALISPKLALGNDPYDRLLSLSYLQAVRYYNQFNDLWLNPKGVLNIAKDDENQKYLDAINSHFKENLGWGNLFSAINKDEINTKWSLKTKHNGLYFPQAGSIATTSLISQLCDGIKYIKAEVAGLKRSGDNWQIEDVDGNIITNTDAVVLACGLNSYGTLNDEQSPLTPNRGQISIIDDNFAEHLPSLSFGHYLTAQFEGENGEKQRIIGASHTRIEHSEISEISKIGGNNWQKFDDGDEDTQLDALGKLTGKVQTPVGYKTGLRATTIDHMPIVGKLGCAEKIKSLPKNRQKIFPCELDQSHRQKNMFIMAGLGARGYQLAPLLAEILASQIVDEPLPADSDIIDAIDPTRFALRRRRHEKL